MSESQRDVMEYEVAIVGAGPALSLPIFNRRELRGALQSQQHIGRP